MRDAVSVRVWKPRPLSRASITGVPAWSGPWSAAAPNAALLSPWPAPSPYPRGQGTPCESADPSYPQSTRNDERPSVPSAERPACVGRAAPSRRAHRAETQISTGPTDASTAAQCDHLALRRRRHVGGEEDREAAGLGNATEPFAAGLASSIRRPTCILALWRTERRLPCAPSYSPQRYSPDWRRSFCPARPRQFPLDPHLEFPHRPTCSRRYACGGTICDVPRAEWA